MPNVYVEARPKGRPEGSSISIEDLWWRITQTTCSAPSKQRSDRLGQKERPFAPCRARAASQRQENTRPLARRRQHSLVNRVACNKTLFAVSNPDLAEPF
jgi:hypothetical protein